MCSLPLWLINETDLGVGHKVGKLDDGLAGNVHVAAYMGFRRVHVIDFEFDVRNVVILVDPDLLLKLGRRDKQQQ